MVDSALQIREKRRRGLIGHMISDDILGDDRDTPPAESIAPTFTTEQTIKGTEQQTSEDVEKPCAKPKTTKASRSKKKKKSATIVQRAYLIDEEVAKALQLKSLAEGRSMSEIVNDAIRASVKEYIGVLNSIK